jgi:hypothetical protein
MSSNDIEKAWAGLVKAGRDLDAVPGKASANALGEAAVAYARALWQEQGPQGVTRGSIPPPPSLGRTNSSAPESRGTSNSAELKVPFGKQKGQRIGDVDSRNLRWLLGVVEESIDSPEKERFRAKNVELRDAVRAELEGRGEL